MRGEFGSYKIDRFQDGSIDVGNGAIGPSTADIARADYIATLKETPKELIQPSKELLLGKNMGWLLKRSPGLALTTIGLLIACSPTEAQENNGQQIDSNVPDRIPSFASSPIVESQEPELIPVDLESQNIDDRVYELIPEEQQDEKEWTTFWSPNPDYNYRIDIPPGWTLEKLGYDPYHNGIYIKKQTHGYISTMGMSAEPVRNSLTLEDYVNIYKKNITQLSTNNLYESKEIEIDGMKAHMFSYKESIIGVDIEILTLSSDAFFLKDGKKWHFRTYTNEVSNKDDSIDDRRARLGKTFEEFDGMYSSFKLLPN